MAPYNKLFEAANKLKKTGLEGVKSTRDATRQMAMAGKQSQALTAAGPALGKMAKFAAYPAGIGAGVGVGTWAAGAGAASAIDNTGRAVRKSWTPETAADAGKMLAGLVLLGLFVGGIVYLYKKVQKG